MEFIKEYFSMIASIGGWCVMLGLYIAKIKQHDKEIEEIKNHQNSTDRLLQSINETLISLNTKVDLLLKGKLTIEGMTNK